jgi:hypothetical protein
MPAHAILAALLLAASAGMLRAQNPRLQRLIERPASRDPLG